MRKPGNCGGQGACSARRKIPHIRPLRTARCDEDPATGALQASQAGNQLLALQVQNSRILRPSSRRAQILESAQHTAAQDQGREQLRRFLTQGAGYQPTTVQMFH